MSKIDEYLANILAARYGRDVRGSIHDAIKLINSIAGIKFGTAITSPTSSSAGFEEGEFYLNTDTFDLWHLVAVNSWEKVGNTRGTDGEDAPTITGVTLVSQVGTKKTYSFDMSDGTSYNFSVEDGIDGTDGTDGKDAPKITSVTLDSQVGLIRTYNINMSDGTSYQFQVQDGQSGTGTGDMLKAVYDQNDNGIVDNAEKVGSADTAVLEKLSENASGQLLYNSKQIGHELVTTQAQLDAITATSEKVVEAYLVNTVKANKYTEETKMLASDLWVGTEAPYTYDLGYDSKVDIEIMLPNTVSAAIVEGVVNAQIAGNGTDNLIRAWGDKPTVDIPLIVRKVVK